MGYKHELKHLIIRGRVVPFPLLAVVCFLTVVVFLAVFADARPPGAILKAGDLTLEIDSTGVITGLYEGSTGDGADHNIDAQPTPLLSLVAENASSDAPSTDMTAHYKPRTWTYAAGTANAIKGETRRGEYTFEFADGIQATVAAVEKAGYATLELTQLANPQHKDIRLLLWGPLSADITESIGETVGVVSNRDFAVGLFGVNARTAILGGWPVDDANEWRWALAKAAAFDAGFAWVDAVADEDNHAAALRAEVQDWREATLARVFDWPARLHMRAPDAYFRLDKVQQGGMLGPTWKLSDWAASGTSGGRRSNARYLAPQMRGFPLTNLARDARVSVSGAVDNSYNGALAVDTGFGVGTTELGVEGGTEWAIPGTAHEKWIELRWESAQKVRRILLYGRQNAGQKVSAGTLTFTHADGSTSTQRVTAIPADGSPQVVDFAQKTVQAVRFTITRSTGDQPGLAEFVVLGPARHYQDSTLATGARVSGVAEAQAARLTDGVIAGGSEDFATLAGHSATLDLGGQYYLNGLAVWHAFHDGRTYKDVIFEVADNEDFENATVVFNNDSDDSLGRGAGADAEYPESSAGKQVLFAPVAARYVRLWSDGNTVNTANHLVEVEVYGAGNGTTDIVSTGVTASNDSAGNLGNAVDHDPATMAEVGPGRQYLQLDLGRQKSVNSLVVMRDNADMRTYKGVVYQLSTSADFATDVTTVFHNDDDNTHGLDLGESTHGEYPETANGHYVRFAPVRARYVRLYSNGSSHDRSNRYREVLVGTETAGTAQRAAGHVGVEASFTPAPATKSKSPRRSDQRSTGHILADTEDTTPPTLIDASVNGKFLVLTFSEAMDLHSRSGPFPSEFTLSGTDNSVVIAQVSYVSLSDTKLQIRLSSAVASGDDDITLSYTPGDTPLRDAALNELGSFSDQTVRNVTTAPTDALVNGKILILTFSGAMNRRAVPSTRDFTLSGTDNDNTIVQINYKSGSATKLQIRLRSAVASDDDGITLSYTPSNRPLRDAAGNDLPGFSNQAVANLLSMGVWTLVNDDAAGVSYDSGWIEDNHRHQFGSFQNDGHNTQQQGATAQYTFTGTGIEYISEKNTDAATVEIFLDGVSQGTVSGHASTRLAQQVFFRKTGLAPGEHTLKVVKQGVNTLWAVVDAFRVYTPPGFPRIDVPDHFYFRGTEITAPLRLPMIRSSFAATYTLRPALPAGLSFDAADRSISGTPTAPKARTEYVLEATYKGETVDTLRFHLTVAASDTQPSFSATQADLVFAKDDAITVVTLPAASGGNGDLTYALYPLRWRNPGNNPCAAHNCWLEEAVGAALPAGLSFDAASRQLSGTPTALRQRAQYTLVATDFDGDTAGLGFHVTVVPALTPAGPSSTLQVWTADPLWRVPNKGSRPSEAPTSIALAAAKNEYESGQVVLRSDADFTINSVTFTDLASGDNTIPKNNLAYHFAEYAVAAKPSRSANTRSNFERTIYPASQTPDPLSNARSIGVVADTAQPILVRVYVPKATVAGTYTGTVTVDTTQGNKSVPLRIKVYDVTVPDTKDSTFLQYNWAETNMYSLETNADLGWAYYGIPKYSEDWWTMLENFAALMVKHRQTMVPIIHTVDLLKDGGTTVAADGTVTFEWGVVDRFVETFKDAGMSHFGGGHLAYHWNGNPGSYTFGAQIVRLARNSRGETIITGSEIPTSGSNEPSHPATRDWLNAFLPALNSHLRSKGWFDNWYQHIWDEPASASKWGYLADKLEANAPGMETLDAAYTNVFRDNAWARPKVKNWVPILPQYTGNTSFYTSQQNLGKKIFIYTTTSPAVPGLNRLMGNHLIAPQLLSWYISKQNLDGYLHWALNLWSYGYADGDATITYPDVAGKTLKSSLRYEAQREGLEDWELLKLVKARNATLAANLVRQVLTGTHTYTIDLPHFRQTRERLLKAAAGETVNLPSPPASFGPGITVPQGATLRNDDHGSISYTGSWSDDNNRQHFREHNNDSHYTKEHNASFEMSFTGTGVDFISQLSHDYGDIDIFIDGVLDTTVSALGVNGRTSQHILYSKRWPTSGTHTIKGVKKSGVFMLVDAFLVHTAAADATLSNLVVEGSTDDTNYSALTLAPAFAADTRSYAAGAASDVTSIKLTPTVNESNATVKVGKEGASLSSVASGTASAAISLVAGENAIAVEVTAQNGYKHTYTVAVMPGRRAVTAVAGVGQLTLGWGAVSGASGYKVQWKSGTEEWDATSRQATVSGGDTTTHTIPNLPAGAAYTVRVAATFENADDGPWSMAATGTPTAVPVLASAQVADTTLTLTFNGALSSTAVPGNSAFTVTVDGAERSLSTTAPVVSGATVTLVLAGGGVATGDVVTVSYSAPAADADKLQDASGRKVANFSGETVRNASIGTWTTVNDDVAEVSYDSGWVEDNDRQQFGSFQNDGHNTQTQGAAAEYTFTGTGVEYISEKNTDAATVEIFLDGVSQGTVSGHASTRLAQQVFFRKTGLAPGAHTLKVVKQGINTLWAVVDAFRVYSVPGFPRGVREQVYVKDTEIIAPLILPAVRPVVDAATYTVTPALPAGLSFDAATRFITGTPTALKARTEYTLTATEGGNTIDTLTFHLTVAASDARPSFSATQADLVFAKDDAITTVTLPAASGGNGDLTYTLLPANWLTLGRSGQEWPANVPLDFSQVPNLPAGLSFDAASRQLSGTPTALRQRAQYTLVATDFDGDTAGLGFHVTVVPALTPAGPSSTLQVWTTDSLWRVHSEASRPSGAPTSIALAAAKNEYESGQVVLRSDADFTINSVTFTDLASGDNTIPKSNLAYHFAEYAVAARPTRPFSNSVPTAIYPASRTPDPLSNARSIGVVADTPQPILVRVYVPKATVAGTYTGTVTVDTTQGNKSVPLRIKVYDVTVPDTKDSTFLQYNWAETNSWSLETNADLGWAYYGIPKYSEDWWTMLENFAALMARHRQTMLPVAHTVDLLKDGGTTVAADGTVTFDWDVFDRFVQTFVDQGISHFGGGHLAYHWNGNPGSYAGGGQQIVRLARNSRGETIITGSGIPTSGSNEPSHPATRDWLNAFLPALNSHLKSKSWFDNWYQHIWDEPATASKWGYLADKLEANAPGMETLDAAHTGVLRNSASARAKVKNWVPILPQYTGNTSFYTSQQNLGKKIFVYTTRSPAAPGLNRLMGNHLIAPQLLSWYISKQNLDGYLHWALNLWSYGYADGDATITYPDVAGKTLKSSLRYEAQREGLEDWELLKLVKARNATLAANLVRQVLTGTHTYTIDLPHFRQTRERLLKAAAGETVNLPSPPASFGPGITVPQGATLRNDDHGSISYTGSWSDDNNRQHFREHNNDSHYTKEHNASFEMSFTGTGVDFISQLSHDYGDIDIFIDGVLDTTVSALGVNGRTSQHILYSKRWPTSGTHTIKGVKKSGVFMLVDAFLVHTAAADATLSNLVVEGSTDDTNYSALTLAPAFAADTRSYAAGAASDVTSIKLTPTVNESNATVKVGKEGASLSSVASGTASAAISLVAGENAIAVEVTAQNGYKHTYTVAVMPDTIAPTLTDVSVNGAALTLTFSEAMDTASVPAAGDFTLAGAAGSGSIGQVDYKAGDATRLELTLGEAVAFGEDGITLSYTAGASPLRDAALNKLGAFSNQAVRNATPDTIAPTLTDVSVNGAALTLTFSEAMDTASVPAAGDFTLAGAAGSGSIGQVDYKAGDATRLELTLGEAVAFGEDGITLSYTAGASPLRDAALNKLGAFSNQAVRNATPDTIAPTLTDVSVNGAALTLTFSEAMDTASVPAAGDFTLAGAAGSGSIEQVDYKAGDATRLELTLGEAVAFGDDGITLSYTAGASPLRDAALNKLGAFSNQAVRNATPDTIAPTLTDVSVNGAALTLTFSEAMDTASVPAAGDFTLAGAAGGGSIIKIKYKAGDAARLELTLSEAVASGEDGITLSYTAGASPLQDAALNKLGAFSDQAVRNATPDTIAPTLTDVSVNGAALTLTFSEAMDTASVPATGDFTLAGAAGSVSIIKIKYKAGDATRLELALGEAVASGEDGITLSYTAGASPLRDAALNKLGAFSDRAVRNATPGDTTAPTLTDVSVNGAALTLTFSEAMDTASVPAADDFILAGAAGSVGIEHKQIDYKAGDATRLELALSEAVASGEDGITLSYTAGASPLQDAALNKLGAFSNQTVKNAPTLTDVSVNGAALTLTFSEAMDTASVPATGDFTLAGAAGGVSIIKIKYKAGDAARLELTLSEAFAFGDDGITLSYTAGASPLRDGALNKLGAFSNQAVRNATPDTIAPTLTDVSVNGAALTLTFSEAMDTTSVPAAGDFTLAGAAGSVSIEQVDYKAGDATRLELTLGEAVASGDDDITLSYTAGASPLRDGALNKLGAFSDQTVQNATPETVGGVTATAGVGQLTVRWTAASDASGYMVQWKSGTEAYDATNRQATVSGGGTTTHTIPNLTAGTAYTVRVAATRTNADDGPWSAEVVGTPTAAAPGQVTGLGVQAAVGQLTVSWSAVSDASGYMVQWKSGTEAYDAANRQATVIGGGTTTHTIPNLTAGTAYTVRVAATRTNADDGSWSAEATGMPTAAAPGQVAGLGVQAMVGQLALSWTAVSDAGGYMVQWKSGTDAYDATNRQAKVSGGGTTTHTIPNLTAGTAYTVRVAATRTNADDGSWSAEATGMPMAAAPGQVTGLGVQAAVGQLTVSWTAVSDASGYMVQWKSGTEAYDATNRQATVSGGGTTTHTIPNLTAGTAYTVRVAATRTNADDGSWSAEVVGTPPTATAAAPVFVSAQVIDTTLTLTFNGALSSTAVPGNSAFTVTVAGGSRALSTTAPVVSGTTVTLALAAGGVATGDTVTVSYSAPAADADKLQNASGGKVANFSDAQVSNASTGTWTLVNDNDGGITYTGDWSRSSSISGAHGGDSHFAWSTDSSAEYTFTGTGIEYIGERDFYLSAEVEIFIDTVSQGRVSAKSSEYESKVVLFRQTGLTSGEHTIKIVNKSTGTLVDEVPLDAFRVYTPATDGGDEGQGQ